MSTFFTEPRENFPNTISFNLSLSLIFIEFKRQKFFKSPENCRFDTTLIMNKKLKIMPI